MPIITVGDSVIKAIIDCYSQANEEGLRLGKELHEKHYSELSEEQRALLDAEKDKCISSINDPLRFLEIW